MSARSRRPPAKRKAQDVLPIAQQVDHESILTTETTATTSKRRKTTKPSPIVDQAQSATTEKRLHRYRTSPTADIRVRIQRALSQRLYLLAVSTTTEPTHREYKVLGQTGNVYTVIITHVPSCTCPDHAKGHLCKHILFVLHRVLKVDRHSPLLYQKALLTVELNEIFAQADAQRGGISSDSTVLAERQVREAYRATTGDPDAILDSAVGTTATPMTVQQKPIKADDDCPICFESMASETNNANNILFCSTSCGNNMHASCFDKWRRAKMSTGEPVTCPFCRVEWKKTTTTTTVTNATNTNTGYLNLAAYSTALIDEDDEDDEDEDEEMFYDYYPRYYSNYRWGRWRRW